MPHLAAHRSVLHPKATLLLQNIIIEPSQQVPLEKKKKIRGGSCWVWTVCMYVCIYSVCVRVWANVCVWLNGKREIDGERIREGSGGVRWPFNLESLMWMTHIWLTKMMDSATHVIWESDPAFFFLYLLRPSSSPILYLSLPSHQHATPFPPSPDFLT